MNHYYKYENMPEEDRNSLIPAITNRKAWKEKRAAERAAFADHVYAASEPVHVPGERSRRRMSAATKRAAAKALAESVLKQREAAAKFEAKSRGHRHHWPLRSDASGEITITRCECGEPYPED